MGVPPHLCDAVMTDWAWNVVAWDRRHCCCCFLLPVLLPPSPTHPALSLPACPAPPSQVEKKVKAAQIIF